MVTSLNWSREIIIYLRKGGKIRTKVIVIRGYHSSDLGKCTNDIKTGKKLNLQLHVIYSSLFLRKFENEVGNVSRQLQ